MVRGLWLGAALAVVVLPGVARADDPNDPAMRSRVARERDRAEIARLNREQLAYVRQRDAGFAPGWAAWRDAHEGSDADDGEARRAQDDYARERAQYAHDMAEWRARVAACRAGDYAACEE